MLLSLLLLLVLTIWVYLALAHSGFWCIDLSPVPSPPKDWPEVVAVIPARDEAEGIAETLRSLWTQDYRGRLRVVLVDDHSEDGMAEIARQTARAMGREEGLTIIEAETLPPGWTGKVWAMHQGVTRGISAEDAARYVLFSDADISHGVDAVRALVCRAEAGSIDLTSFMVRLHCGTSAERMMIPAFVFFFRMLYPFRLINNLQNPLAGAAGGTMLVRRTALERIGGLTSIRGELIDDCSLARQIKQGGHALYLGLSETSCSTRIYNNLSEIFHMIARTAYTQLNYSPIQLLGCVFGLALTFIAPLLLLLFGKGLPALFGGLAYLIMSLLYLPMVRFYRQSPFWVFLLPLTSLLYLSATLLSAYRYYRGKGGQWKGRSQSVR